MKTLELHYSMIQFLITANMLVSYAAIFWDVAKCSPEVSLGERCVTPQNTAADRGDYKYACWWLPCETEETSARRVADGKFRSNWPFSF